MEAVAGDRRVSLVVDKLVEEDWSYIPVHIG